MFSSTFKKPNFKRRQSSTSAQRKSNRSKQNKWITCYKFITVFNSIKEMFRVNYSLQFKRHNIMRLARFSAKNKMRLLCRFKKSFVVWPRALTTALVCSVSPALEPLPYWKSIEKDRILEYEKRSDHHFRLEDVHESSRWFSDMTHAQQWTFICCSFDVFLGNSKLSSILNLTLVPMEKGHTRIPVELVL